MVSIRHLPGKGGALTEMDQHSRRPLQRRLPERGERLALEVHLSEANPLKEAIGADAKDTRPKHLMTFLR